MNTPFNPISTSGIGFELEHYVQASYLASLLLETPVPFGNGLQISELNFQAKQIADTDDIIVTFFGDAKFFVQSKKGFEINSNDTFYEVIESLWKDFNSSDFDKKNNKFIITTDTLSKADWENGLLVLEWAKFSKDNKDFIGKLKSNNLKYTKFKYFLKAIEKANGGAVDGELSWEFLKAISVKVYDYLQPESKDKEVLKWYLKPFLKPGVSPENALFALMDYIRRSNRSGASLTKDSIEVEIKSNFDLLKSPAIGLELIEFIKKSTGQVQHSIQNDLDGFRIDRNEYLLKISEALSQKKMLLISGEGGVGKSGLAKEYLEYSFKSDSGYLVFKADQLDRSSLAHTFSDLGVGLDFETLLSQWVLLPRLIIYIDSFEKLYESEHKEAFLELLGKIKLTNNNIRIIATCRSFAIETLRSKYKIPKEELAIIELSPLTEDQLSQIAKAKPKLQKIISNSQLLRLISLPFYLDIANQIIDSISNVEELNEVEFKKALWDFIVEKKGATKKGRGKIRADVFSRIVLKRAIEKIPFVKPPDNIDLNITSELETEGLLLRHQNIEAYSPAHDIFEDIVVINYLDEKFHNKINNAAFLQSIDTNPVFRRAIRQWIQELILYQTEAAKIFLSEIFPLYSESGSLIDEILIGILGSGRSYYLIKLNSELFLNNNLRLFSKSFELLKLAYTQPYVGEHPERMLTAIGTGWIALLKILDENYLRHEKSFRAILLDLLHYWTMLFNGDDELPEGGEIVVKYCILLLNDDNIKSFSLQKHILEIIFSIAELNKDFIEKILTESISLEKRNVIRNDDLDYPVKFYDDLDKMLLVDTFRCVRVYKLFPALVVELAKKEWYSSKTEIDEYETRYMEYSYGLREYPYKYFNSSAYQTPFRFLFKYHPDIALSFLIEMCNRSISFYLKSTYAKQAGTRKVALGLNDGSTVELYADSNLWLAYRGMGSSPYLIQSAIMAFEAYLVRAADTDTISGDLFEKVIRESNSILPVAVFGSVAMAHPLIFDDKILSLLKVRAFFAWDLSRYSNEFLFNHTEIGNDYYYTNERRLSNKLRHRKSNLEDLVRTLQFYYPKMISGIIDEHKSKAADDDNSWHLALIRMDMRNTTPEIREEEEVIFFKPNPLPDKIQEFIDENKDEREADSVAINIFLWADKAFKAESDTPLTYNVWKDHFEKFKTIGFAKLFGIQDSSKKLASIGIKYFATQLTEDEKKYCVDTMLVSLEGILSKLKKGDTYSNIDIITDDTFSVYPVLLNPAFAPFCDVLKIKEFILDLLILLPDETKQHLAAGIKEYGWGIDQEYSHQCFQVLLKASKSESFFRQIYVHRNISADKFLYESNRILAEIKDVPDVQANDIDLMNDDEVDILMAFKTVSYGLLKSTYREYLNEIMAKITDIEPQEFKVHVQFIEGCQIILAEYLISNPDENGATTFNYLLSLHTKNFTFVMDSLKRLIWIAHDMKYPKGFWFHFNLLDIYTFTKSPKIGFIQTLLFEPLKNSEYCYKIPDIASVRKLHETIVSEFAADKNLMESVFKLLVGVGTIYQPNSLSWIMKSLPERKAYYESLNLHSSISNLTTFVNQLYSDHIDYIKTNKEQMNYFIMLLNLLMDRGSTRALRIRDELI